MKQLFSLACCLFALQGAWAQGAKWDSTYRPATYPVQVDMFRSFPNSKKDIIFLGNSLTAHMKWDELLGNKWARNRGISGDITFGVLQRLDEVIEGRPKKVFLLIGINDISRNIPDSLIVANYRTIVSRIRQGSPRTRIYLQTLLPVNNEFTQFKNHYNKDQHIEFINKSLREMAQTCKVQLIDLHPQFLDSEGKLKKEFTEDGLHLNAAGYTHWASILKNGNYLK